MFSLILPHFFCLSDWRVCLLTFLEILSVLMHLLSLYQSCTNFMTLLNPRNCSTQHQPEEKTDKPSISKAVCGWAGTWISIKQAIYINRCTRDLQHNSASSLVGQVLHMTCAACATLVEYTVCSWRRQTRLYQRQQTMDSSAHAILAWLCQHFQPSRDYFHFVLDDWWIPVISMLNIFCASPSASCTLFTVDHITSRDGFTSCQTLLKV